MSIKTVSRSALTLAISATLAGGALLVSTAPANASPGAAHHLAAAAAVSHAKSSSLGTKWTWANGKQLKAKELRPTALKRSAYRLSVDHSQGTLQGAPVTLPNGHGVGVTDRGRLVELTKTGPKPYVRGATPKNLDAYALAVRGRTVFAITERGVVYRFEGHTKPAAKISSTSADVISAAFTSDRVYWDQAKNGKNDSFTYQVFSRSLTGGPARLEANNAFAPQATEQGVLVTTLPGTLTTASQGRLTGIGLLKGGKAVPFLKFNGSRLNSQIGDGPWTFAASGHTLTLSNAGTSGQVVVNLRNHRAWHVAAPKGTVPGWTGVGGHRAAWTIASPEGNPVRNIIYVADVDSGTVRTLASRAGASAPSVNGGSVGFAYPRSQTRVQYKSIVVK